MARLATHIWVGAYLQRLTAEGIFAHVSRRGDATAGAVAVKVAFMDGRASFFSRAYDWEGRLAWNAEFEGEAEERVDEAIRRRRAQDPDLWVIEVEDPRGRHMLDAPGLSE